MIANYTTTIATTKTVGEIQSMLGRAGAGAVMVDYSEGEPSALTFNLLVEEQRLWFRLPFRPEGVLAALRRDGAPKRFLTVEHAQRVGARIVRDWIRAQLAIVDAGQAEFAEVMLPYLVDDTGETLWQRLLSGRLALPAAPDGEVVEAEYVEEG